MHTSIKYLIRKGTVFCSGFVIQCQGCTCAGWLWEGEGGLGDHQPGVYVPLKALFLVLRPFIKKKMDFGVYDSVPNKLACTVTE